MVSHNNVDNFENIIGYEAIKDEMRKLVDVLKNPDKYRKLGVSMPHGLLLHGEPGLGKTMSAECFMEEMKEAGWQTRTIRREETSEEYIQKVKEIFEEAGRAGHYIILLDDIDKASEGDLNQVTPSEYSVIQSFIDAVKDKSVFVIATANSLRTLPDSLLRAGRFDKQIYFDMPAYEDRKKIIQFYLTGKRVESGVFDDASEMLCYRSSAEIDTILKEAAILAGFHGREEISLEDLKWAVMEIIYDWDRAESANSDDPVLKQYIALHEAGHVLAREYYFPKSVRLVTILPCTHHEQGMTISESNADDELWNTAIEGTIVSHLAGRAAINLNYGFKMNTGDADDLQRAYDTLCRLISQSASKGFAYYYEPGGSKTPENVAIVARSEMENYYNLAVELLIKNSDQLDALAEALVEKGTLAPSEIREILEQNMTD